ncbi:MAG: hypothetical protein JOY90_07575 [Bradyrhizobium sp.]|uniref:hypothetical protein n=1 Tax=Bradyrhizobium sp. TaxID=376 RepID=UPI001DEEAB95|nr:hypothetical protein [Bradyrhizobium sp.]
MYAAAAGAAAITALLFFTIALFVWLRESYGTVEACLALGLIYLVVALAALAAVFVLQRRHPEPPPAPKKAAPQWWQDPMILTTGLEAARILGPRKAVTLAAVAAFVVGFFVTGSRLKKP